MAHSFKLMIVDITKINTSFLCCLLKDRNNTHVSGHEIKITIEIYCYQEDAMVKNLCMQNDF